VAVIVRRIKPHVIKLIDAQSLAARPAAGN